jgi:predicted Zn-dependent peptidase
VDYPGLRDATIFVGNLAMSATSSDFFSFLVLNQVLGGTTGSRLFMDLRESKSFAYYAFSEAEFFRFCGAYWAKARVPPDAVHAAILEIIKELGALSSETAVPTEIEEAKSFLIGNLPLKFASQEGFSTRLAQVVALGLGEQHWGGFTDSLMLVNVEKVLEVAKRYFPPLPVVVIVGDETWASVALRDFKVVDIFDKSGAFKMTWRKGVDR